MTANWGETNALPPRTRARNLGELSALLVVIVAWFMLIQRFGSGDVYAVMGPFGIAVSALCIALRPRDVIAWLQPRWKLIAIGVTIGAVMTLVTYPLFRLCARLIPGLEAQVQALYQGARGTALPTALGWIAVLGLAEELLFRGALPDVLRAFMPERAAFAVSLVCYALAQLGTGSVIVALMAASCGAVWTVQRVLTRSLLSPLIAHLIWSPVVILLYPVA